LNYARSGWMCRVTKPIFFGNDY